MKAFASTGPGSRLTEMELEIPELKGKEVLIKITHSGVCHSDVHLKEGDFDLGSAGKMPITAAGATYPAVFGHEILGTVEAAGPEASVQPGDTKYIVFPWIGCGECQICKEERENECPQGRSLGIVLHGGFADHVWVPDEKYLIELGDLEPGFGAALACSGVTAFSAVKKTLPADANDVIGVIGAGGVGLMAIACLKALGHNEILSIDVNDDSLAIAKEMGAKYTFNSTTGGPEELIAAAGSQPAAIIDLVYSGETAALGLGSLRRSGKLIGVGLFGGEHTYPTPLVPLQMLTIRGNYVGSLPELQELVDIAKQGQLPQLPITEKDMTEENVNEALDGLANKTIRGRTILTVK